MKIREISSALEAWAPPSLAESYDNAGLLVGNPQAECTGILINLDMTEDVVDEAVRRGCNLIIAHHPIWFTPIKRLTGSDYVSRTIMKAIRKDIALYAIHTNLDNVMDGVNRKIAAKIGLENLRILSPKPGILRKLVVYVPVENREVLLSALFEAGAGRIGNYDSASFSQEGTGTFRPLEGANPAIGQVGERESVREARIEVVFPSHLTGAVTGAMKNAHPYEEVAYQILQTENSVAEIGSGMVGELPAALSKGDFLHHIKEVFRCGGIRYADAALETVKKVAICGGSGSFLTPAALRTGADALVTADITYHKFFDAGGRMLLLDIGHFESEQFTSELLRDFLSGKFPNFAVHLSEINTNPVKYL